MTRFTFLGLSAMAFGYLLTTGGSAGAQVIIHPSAVQPGANVAIPGSQQFWSDPLTGASGYRYLGIDGRWHGVTSSTDPFSGNKQLNVYAPNPNAGKPSGSMTPNYPKPSPTVGYKPSPLPPAVYKPTPYSPATPRPVRTYP